jgi:hypothetical protein
MCYIFLTNKKKHLKAESCDMKVNKRETYLVTFKLILWRTMVFNFSNVSIKLHMGGTLDEHYLIIRCYRILISVVGVCLFITS